MSHLRLACLLVLVSVPAVADSPEAGVPLTGALVPASEIQDPVSRDLIQRQRSSERAWKLLADLCDSVGARLSGSSAMARAVRWAAESMTAQGVEKVWQEEVMVPVWVRGAESLTMTEPLTKSLAILGLGSSVGTQGISAEVMVVHHWDELGPEAEGKIVLYNVPMPSGLPSVKHYGATVGYRLSGADRAAAHGAIGVLMRSVTTRSLYTPHTGTLYYSGEQEKIPAAAITTEDADLIERLTLDGKTVRVRLEMGAQTLPDAVSHNVLGEIQGSEYPEEIVLIGAHLDSWDVGQGAHDDGAGVVEVIETMRMISALDVRPKRTIRAVLFTNEENGTRGGKDYAAAHGQENHIVAIECDLGGGRPLSWGATGSPSDLAWLRTVAEPFGLPINDGGGGSDIRPLGEYGTLLIGLRPDDSSYFDIHHTHADTVDKVDPAALAESTAALVSLTWSLANAAR